MKRVGRYLVEEQNQDGSFIARDPALDRAVVIHLLPATATPEEHARFERHARTAAAVDHPNVARVLEVGESDGAAFVARERVEGATIAEVAPHAPVAKVERWLLQIARALEAAHAAGVIHRNVGGASVRIAPSGTAKLVDFSSARLDDDESFRTSTIDRGGLTASDDRKQWGAMALDVLAGRANRFAQVANEAKAGAFESTEALVTRLEALRPAREPFPIFLAALSTTALVLSIAGVAAYLARRKPAATSALTVNVDAGETSVVADVEAPPTNEPSAVVTTAAHAAVRELPGTATANILAGEFAEEDVPRVRAFVRALGPKLVACMRRDVTGLPHTTRWRVDVQIFPPGRLASVTPNGVAFEDRSCVFQLLESWPRITPAKSEANFSIDVERRFAPAGP